MEIRDDISQSDLYKGHPRAKVMVYRVPTVVIKSERSKMRTKKKESQNIIYKVKIKESIILFTGQMSCEKTFS